MNNFIKDLSDFLFDFTDFLESNKFISPINKKQISIDYSSNNKQGDLATNFYLIIKRKIINEDLNIEIERLICDYISGMTDRFALNLYKEICE